MESLHMAAQWLEALRTPAILILVALAVWGWMTLRSLRTRIGAIEDGKADRKELNGVRGVVNKIEKELGERDAKTRMAVVGIATKIDAPEVLKDFLK